MFTPEFRNRLDATIPFAGLSQEIVGRVVDKFIIQLEEQLSDKGVVIVLSDEARAWLATKGYDPKMGARPLGRTIPGVRERSRWPRNCCSVACRRAAGSGSASRTTSCPSTTRTESPPDPGARTGRSDGVKGSGSSAFWNGFTVAATLLPCPLPGWGKRIECIDFIQSSRVIESRPPLRTSFEAYLQLKFIKIATRNVYPPQRSNS